MKYLNPSTYSGGAQQIIVPDQPPAPEVEEAPFDNGQYTRVNGEWVPIAASQPTFSVDGVGDPPSGFTIYGTEFLDWIDPLPKGIVAKALRDVDSSNTTTTEQPYLQLDADLKAGRSYKLTLNIGIYNDTAAGRDIARVRCTTDGTAPGITSPELRGVRANHPIANITMPVVITKLIEPTVDTDYRFLATFRGELGTVHVSASPDAPSEMWIEDLGLQKEDTGIDRAGTVTLPPPVSPPPTLKTYTKTYTSTTAKCYMGSGAADSSQGAEDMKQGYSSYDGDSESLWIFPPFTGAIGAASISKVRLYLYANHWTNYSGGTALIKRHNYSSAPASSPSQVSVTSSADWPRPGGRWVTLPSSVYAGIIGNTIKGFGVGPAGSTSGLYYGRFNKAGAKVEITYKR
jgi:hypothetical protein